MQDFSFCENFVMALRDAAKNCTSHWPLDWLARSGEEVDECEWRRESELRRCPSAGVSPGNLFANDQYLSDIRYQYHLDQI